MSNSVNMYKDWAQLTFTHEFRGRKLCPPAAHRLRRSVRAYTSNNTTHTFVHYYSSYRPCVFCQRRRGRRKRERRRTRATTCGTEPCCWTEDRLALNVKLRVKLHQVEGLSYSSVCARACMCVCGGVRTSV